MGLNSIGFSHLIRCSRPSWTMLPVRGMCFPGFRLSGAYFDILLQPMFWAYPGLNPELQCSAQGHTFSPLRCSSFMTVLEPRLFFGLSISNFVVFDCLFNIHFHMVMRNLVYLLKTSLTKVCIHVWGSVPR